MYCTNCGHKNEEGAKFCQNCGQALKPADATAPPPTPQTPIQDQTQQPTQPQVVYVQMPPNQQQEKKRNKAPLIAGMIIALMLGCIGWFGLSLLGAELEYLPLGAAGPVATLYDWQQSLPLPAFMKEPPFGLGGGGEDRPQQTVTVDEPRDDDPGGGEAPAAQNCGVDKGPRWDTWLTGNLADWDGDDLLNGATSFGIYSHWLQLKDYNSETYPFTIPMGEKEAITSGDQWTAQWLIYPRGNRAAGETVDVQCTTQVDTQLVSCDPPDYNPTTQGYAFWLIYDAPGCEPVFENWTVDDDDGNLVDIGGGDAALRGFCPQVNTEELVYLGLSLSTQGSGGATFSGYGLELNEEEAAQVSVQGFYALPGETELREAECGLKGEGNDSFSCSVSNIAGLTEMPNWVIALSAPGCNLMLYNDLEDNPIVGGIAPQMDIDKPVTITRDGVITSPTNDDYCTLDPPLEVISAYYLGTSPTEITGSSYYLYRINFERDTGAPYPKRAENIDYGVRLEDSFYTELTYTQEHRDFTQPIQEGYAIFAIPVNKTYVSSQLFEVFAEGCTDPVFSQELTIAGVPLTGVEVGSGPESCDEDTEWNTSTQTCQRIKGCSEGYVETGTPGVCCPADAPNYSGGSCWP